MTMINNYLTKAIPEGLQPYVNDSVVNNLELFLLWVLMILLYVAALLLLARFLRKFNRFNYVIYISPINEYTNYLLAEIWIRPTIIYGLVACFVSGKEDQV